MRAMPIAPPRLRMRLKSPLASGTRSGARWPSANRVGGRMQNMIAPPRTTCGQNMPAKSVSRVSKTLMAQPAANAAKPNAVRTRKSTRRSRDTARRSDELGDASHQHGLADPQRGMSAHECEKDRHEIHRAKQADAEQKAEGAAGCKTEVGQGAQVDERIVRPTGAAHE